MKELLYKLFVGIGKFFVIILLNIFNIFAWLFLFFFILAIIISIPYLGYLIDLKYGMGWAFMGVTIYIGILMGIRDAFIYFIDGDND